jgi:hypothetical protein
MREKASLKRKRLAGEPVNLKEPHEESLNLVSIRPPIASTGAEPFGCIA